MAAAAAAFLSAPLGIAVLGVSLVGFIACAGVAAELAVGVEVRGAELPVDVAGAVRDGEVTSEDAVDMASVEVGDTAGE